MRKHGVVNSSADDAHGGRCCQRIGIFIAAERDDRQPLTKEHGVWVFHSGEPLPASATDDMLQQIREERDLANLGKGE